MSREPTPEELKALADWFNRVMRPLAEALDRTVEALSVCVDKLGDVMREMGIDET